MLDEWDDVDIGRPIAQYFYHQQSSIANAKQSPTTTTKQQWQIQKKLDDAYYDRQQSDSGANSSFSSGSRTSNYTPNDEDQSRESSVTAAAGRGIRGRGKQSDDGGAAANYQQRQPPTYNGSAAEGDSGGGETISSSKDFYIPPEPTNDEQEIFGQSISTGINFELYDKIPIKVTGENCPAPIQNFQQCGLSPNLLTNVLKSGYTQPTPIQKNAIPIVLSGRDIMGCAQTGSGKTAAFLLPIIHTLVQYPRPLIVGQPQVCIVSPTRELASQIYLEARKFALGSYLQMCILYGGTSFRHQVDKVQEGCQILVATPGRLLDFVKKNIISFESIRFVVLDEADRMLDLGFMPAIEKVINHPTMVPSAHRSTIMFSATFPEDIQRLAAKFLAANYVFLAVGIIGGACSDVRQTMYAVGKFDKRLRLLALLNEADPSGTIVFVETRRQADFLASFLSESAHPTTSIHGDRLQRQREEALRDFKSNKMKVLIATSVAARGLDIKNVTHVINYDLPKDIDEYVHRIGRTGRLGNRGRATSFFDADEDRAIAAELVKILQQADHEVPDFLLKCSEQSAVVAAASFGSQNRFGGRDVRSGGDVNSRATAAKQPPLLHQPNNDQYYN